jgi:putative glycerol-1-phosphate prenyltransferase
MKDWHFSAKQLESQNHHSGHWLESGAQKAVPLEMITTVAKRISVPLIVGGGIRSKYEIEEAFNAGAAMVVIGTAFENDLNFFD